MVATARPSWHLVTYGSNRGNLNVLIHNNHIAPHHLLAPPTPQGHDVRPGRTSLGGSLRENPVDRFPASVLVDARATTSGPGPRRRGPLAHAGFPYPASGVNSRRTVRSFDSRRGSTRCGADLLPITRTEGGRRDVDFHLLDGPSVCERRLVLFTHRRTVIHADIEGLGSEP